MVRKLQTKHKLIVALAVILILALALFWLKGYRDQRILASVQAATENRELVYAADDSAPPLRFVDSDGIYKGVVVDYITQIALELGIEIRCEPYLWEDALTALDEGETDFCDMFISPDRAEKYVFTDPIYILRTVLAVKADSDYTLQDINSLTIATQKGDYANGYLESHYPKAKLVYVHDVGEALRYLADGKVDAAIGDEPVLSYYADKEQVQDKIEMINTALYEEEVVIAMSKENADLVEPFNIAIRNMKATGQLEKIQQKWFGISTPLLGTEDSSKNLMYLLMALLVICLVVILKQVETVSLKRQVRKRTYELEANRNELKLIFNEMPEAVVIVKDDMTVVNCNTVAEELFGREGQSLNGSSFCQAFAFFCRDCQDCRDCETCMIKNSFASGEDKMQKLQIDGKVYEIRVFPIESAAEKQMVMVTVKNITEEEVRNKQLLQSSKMIAVGQLAAGMAHQIRNPLGIIRTHSFIIRQNTDSETILNSLEYIDASVKRSSRIVDNVMNFWRISGIKGEAVKMKKFIQRIVDLETGGMKEKDITLTVNCEEDLVFMTNQESLKHILINLIQNAVDAITVTPGRVIITAELTDTGRLELKVKDNGCGIKKEDMASLFNPFFTTKEPGKGTGLGLYIVYSEIENIGGTIEVESEEGRGACFTIRLPEIENEVKKA